MFYHRERNSNYPKRRWKRKYYPEKRWRNNREEEPISAFPILSLPEGCLSHILSLTSPIDAGRSAAVSREFRSAAESETIWEKFLPSDYQQIISRSTPLDFSTKKGICSSIFNNGIFLDGGTKFSTKKDLYSHLCNNALLLDGGTKSFTVDKTSGKKCCMLGARELKTSSPDGSHCWSEASNSRFFDVAILDHTNSFVIKGKMETRLLSSKTIYAAYFVYMPNSYFSGFDFVPINTSAGLVEAGKVIKDDEPDELNGGSTLVFLSAPGARFGWKPEEKDRYGLPRQRLDRWLEVEMGEFFNNGDDGHEQVLMQLWTAGSHNLMSGLIFQGIELRPKEGNQCNDLRQNYDISHNIMDELCMHL